MNFSWLMFVTGFIAGAVSSQIGYVVGRRQERRRHYR